MKFNCILNLFAFQVHPYNAKYTESHYYSNSNGGVGEETSLLALEKSEIQSPKKSNCKAFWVISFL